MHHTRLLHNVFAISTLCAATVGFTRHSLPFSCTFIQLLFSASPFHALCLLDADVEPNSLRHDWAGVYAHIWLVAVSRAGVCTSPERAAVAETLNRRWWQLRWVQVDAWWCPIYPLIGANMSWFCYTQCRLVKPPKCLTHFHPS